MDVDRQSFIATHNQDFGRFQNRKDWHPQLYSIYTYIYVIFLCPEGEKIEDWRKKIKLQIKQRPSTTVKKITYMCNEKSYFTWSVIWAIPLNTRACNCPPIRVINFPRISSVKLSDESKSREVRDLQFPDSIHAFNTESLNPFIWPALRNFSAGIRVNISIRHSDDKSAPVMSNSWRRL